MELQRRRTTLVMLIEKEMHEIEEREKNERKKKPVASQLTRIGRLMRLRGQVQRRNPKLEVVLNLPTC